MTPFLALRCPRMRMQACREGGSSASISPGLWTCLQAACQAGRLRILEGMQVASGWQDNSRWHVQFVVQDAAKTGMQEANAWPSSPLRQLRGACQPDSAQAGRNGAAPAPEAAFKGAGQHPGPGPGEHVETTRCCAGPAPDRAANPTHQAAPPASPSELCVDQIWLATGHQTDVEVNPVLAGLQRSHPTRIVGGYPLLDDNTLAWPGTPVFLLGRTALLSMGPAAGSPSIPFQSSLQDISSMLFHCGRITHQISAHATPLLGSTSGRDN